MISNKYKLYHYDSSTLFCSMNKVHENQEGMKLNGPHQLLVYANYAHLLSEPKTQWTAQRYKVRPLQAF